MSTTLDAPLPPKPADSSAVHHLRRLIEVARGKTRPLVHLQHNPDPDALASGAALKHLLGRLLGVEAVLAYTGRVGRVENRAMLRYLKIEIKPAYKIDYGEHDLIMVVDTHPGSGTCQLPAGVVPHVVVDHHPHIAEGAAGEMAGVAFPYCDPNYGSTSTMVGALYVENDIQVPARIATALTYGIRTDTQDFARSGNPHDEHIFKEMYAAADKKILARIERARVPQEYFVTLERGLRRAQVTDFAVTTTLGEVEHSDIVAEVADLLFRLEGIKWVLVAGHDGEMLFASLRALKGKDVDAGQVAHAISEGHGGGHDTFSALQYPMRLYVPPEPEEGGSDAATKPDPDHEGPDPEVVYEALVERFLKEVGAKRTLTRPLTLPPEEPPSAPEGDR